MKKQTPAQVSLQGMSLLASIPHSVKRKNIRALLNILKCTTKPRTRGDNEVAFSDD